jgi:hypothetical protein
MIHASVVRRVRGVALILSNPRGEILLLQELQTKPHFGKYAGMRSPPMETCFEGEQNDSTLDRLVDEELPGFAGRIKIDRERRGVYRIVPGVWVSLYVGQTEDSLLPTPNEKTEEVGGYIWVSPEEALELWLRQGAREMLAHYIEPRRGVLCRHCCSVSSSGISK